MKYFFKKMIVVLFFFLLCQSGWADEKAGIGYVSAVRGDVIAINSSGVARAFAVENPIFLDDLINTDKRSRVRMILHDNTVVTLGQKSTIMISDYMWSKTDKTGRFNVAITEGIFRIMGGAITKSCPENFVTRTPSATIGIRGSAYAGKVDGPALTIVLESGKGIDVYNDYGSVALLAPGMGTTVDDINQPPAPARLFNISEISVILDGLDMDSSDGGPGSIIGPDSVIINKSKIKNSANIAVGANSTANMGSIVIKDSKVNGTVINKAGIKDSANVASGADNDANMGTIVID